MTLLECDLEEGSITEKEERRIEGDEDLFLDNFEDPFTIRAKNF